MKLASLKSKTSRDGELIVVSKDNQYAAKASHIAPSFIQALDNWQHCKDGLKKIYNDLNNKECSSSFKIKTEDLHSPLPRSYAWLDGSAFLHHVRLVRKARNAELPESLLRVPLMYQGGSDDFLSPTDDIPQIDFSHGTDFEGEVGVITDFIPMGSSPEFCESKILFFVIINDVSLRGLIPEEIERGFGFLQGKPSSSFAPFAVSPEELGSAWKNGRVHLELSVKLNSEFFGKANAKEMHFSFGELLAHACRTRNLSAGTILGSGTISNENPAVGSSCLAEKRMLEKINTGEIKTPFMKDGDQVEIEMFDENQNSIFGKIQQKVKNINIK